MSDSHHKTPTSVSAEQNEHKCGIQEVLNIDGAVTIDEMPSCGDDEQNIDAGVTSWTVSR